MYGDGAQTPKCVECALGTYNAASKQTECIACDSPKSTLLTGSTEADDCKGEYFCSYHFTYALTFTFHLF